MDHTETEDTKTARIRSVDVLRGFALICMVLVHFMIHFGDEAAVDTRPYKYALVGAIPAMVWGFAALFLLVWLLVIWGKHKNKCSLEWFLGVATGRFAPY